MLHMIIIINIYSGLVPRPTKNGVGLGMKLYILHPCFCGNRWVLFSIYRQEVVDSVNSVPYTIGSCKMMFPINYLVYSVNYTYFTCLLITYLVYNENYHVCLLITIRDKSEMRI